MVGIGPFITIPFWLNMLELRESVSPGCPGPAWSRPGSSLQTRSMRRHLGWANRKHFDAVVASKAIKASYSSGSREGYDAL